MLPLTAMTEVGVPIIVALIAAGLGAWLKDIIKAVVKRAAGSSKEQREQRAAHEAVAAANQSLVAVGLSQKQLQDDNSRLRTERTESDARWQAIVRELEERHARDRAYWESKEADLKCELEQIENKWREALDELIAFRNRTGLTSPLDS